MNSIIETKNDDYNVFLEEFNKLNLSFEKEEIFKISKIPKHTYRRTIFPWRKTEKVTYSEHEYVMRKNSCISLLCLCLELQAFLTKFYIDTSDLKEELNLNKISLKNNVLIFARDYEDLYIKCDGLPKLECRMGFYDYDNIEVKNKIYSYLKKIYIIINFSKVVNNGININSSTNLGFSIERLFEGKLSISINIKDLALVDINISASDINFTFFASDLQINEFLDKLNSEYEYSLLEKIFINENNVKELLAILQCS